MHNVIATSDKGVVEYHEADEDAVKYSKCNKKTIERVLHLLAWEDDDRENVSHQTKQANAELE